MSRRSGARRRNVHAHAERILAERMAAVRAAGLGPPMPLDDLTRGPYPVRHQVCGATVGQAGATDQVTGDGRVFAGTRPWVDRDDVADVVAWLCPRCRVPVGMDVTTLTVQLNLHGILDYGDTRWITAHTLPSFEQPFV